MKAMVIYDSAYGNTGQIAQAIGVALGSAPDVNTMQVGDVTPDLLAGLDLLMVGSPTQRFSPTPAISNFIQSIPSGSLNGMRVAAFDTRFTVEKMKSLSGFLSFTAKLVGDSAYAAKKIADGLEKKGGKLAAPPEGFFVGDTEGPLLEGELERAADWARRFLS